MQKNSRNVKIIVCLFATSLYSNNRGIIVKEDDDEVLRLNGILDDLLRMFPFHELQSVLGSMRDPLDCKNTAELMEVIEKNMELIKEKEEFYLKSDVNHDRSSIKNYMANPNNFSKEQWEAIEDTRKRMRAYEREVDYALETGQIEVVGVDKKKKEKKSKRKRMKKFNRRKKWMQA